MAIFAHGTPDRISDNIHSSNKQRYQGRHHQQSGSAGPAHSTASSAFEDNVRLWESQRTSEYNPSPGKSSSYSFNDQNVRRSNQFAHNPAYQDAKSNFSPNPRLSLSGRTLTSSLEVPQNTRVRTRKNRRKHAKASKRNLSPLISRNTEDDSVSLFVPAEEAIYSDAGDTIDLSKIGDESNFEIAVGDVRPSRLKVTREELLKNSIDRFDAFGDYEYIDSDQYPKKVEFHQPLKKRPPYLRRIDDSVYDPYFWEHRGNVPRRRQHQTTVRRHDNNFRFPGKGTSYRRHEVALHPNHNYNPQQQTFQDTFTYHNPLTKVPASQFATTQNSPASGIFGSLLKLAGFGDKSENTGYYQNHNHGSSKPSATKGGIFSLLLGSSKKDDIQYPDYYNGYDHPYGEPGYGDYDYGDYNEGVGLYPPKKLTISQRVAKWFSGFKIPSTKRRRFGGSRFPGERVTLGGGYGHGQYPLDYDYYDSGDDHNLIFYGQHNGHLGSQGLHSDDFDFTDITEAIKNNNTGVELAKRVLSKLAKLTERSGDSNSLFMMWTIPTTILALMGIVYFVGAAAIVGYKYSLFFGGDANQAVNLIPVVIAFSLPLIFGILLVSGRASLNVELDVSRVMKGDFSRSMSSDFDGVDFTLDGIFGSFGLLGLAWVASVTI